MFISSIGVVLFIFYEINLIQIVHIHEMFTMNKCIHTLVQSREKDYMIEANANLYSQKSNL
jgi:hypothetical protein